MTRFGVFLYVLGLAQIASIAAADDIKGKVAAVDLDKRTITITVDAKDQTYEVGPSAKVYRLSGNNARRAGYAESPGGLKDVAVDATVIVTTDFIDGREQATRIKIESSSGKPLKRPKDNPPPPTESKTTTDVDGSIIALDPRRLQMTLTVDGKPRKFTVTKDCSVLLAVKSDKKKTRYDVAPNGLADITVGLDVTITIDSQSGKELVTTVKIKNPPGKSDTKPGK
jgi:hypothetical protein